MKAILYYCDTEGDKSEDITDMITEEDIYEYNSTGNLPWSLIADLDAMEYSLEVIR